MLPIIHHRAGKVFAVGFALAAWLGGAYWFELQDLSQRIGCHLSGIAIFFLLAVFLPEERKLRSVSRQGALLLTGFAVFLMASDVAMHFRNSMGAALGLGLLVGGPLLSYFGGLFLIRGLRTPPQYGREPETAGQTEAEAKVAGEPRVPAPAAAEDSRVQSLLGRLEGSAVGRA